MRAVIDTNVVFEGLTKTQGACFAILEAWRSGGFQACVSNAVAYEYLDVLARKLSAARWRQIEPLLESLLGQVEFVTIHISWRPASPDPGDDHMIDCAMNAGAVMVTLNMRDFAAARLAIGLQVLTPEQFVALLNARK